jgi:hypothetical protein
MPFARTRASRVSQPEYVHRRAAGPFVWYTFPIEAYCAGGGPFTSLTCLSALGSPLLPAEPTLVVGLVAGILLGDGVGEVMKHSQRA